MTDTFQEPFQEVVAFVLQEAGLDLIHFKIHRHRGDWRFEVLADRPSGGITIEQCAVLNRRILEEMAKENLWREDHYSLSVSSPGLDWPLKTQKDFLRVIERNVRFLLAEPVQERWEYAGNVRSVGEEELVIATSHGEMTISFTKIKKAVQII